MKKNEAGEVSVDKSKVVIEFIKQILSDTKRVIAKMEFNWAKIDSQNMCTLDIYVPSKQFERHLNLQITIDHCDVFYSQLFKDLISNFLNDDVCELSSFMCVKGIIGNNFNGLVIANKKTNTQISLNFKHTKENFNRIVDNYNKTLESSLINQEQFDGVKSK